jgi:hypothetical protein
VAAAGDLVSLMSAAPQAPKLSPEEERVRRRRSIAIALGLGGLAVMFYAVSMVKTTR